MKFFKILSKKIVHFQAGLILTMVYFLLVPTFAIVLKLFQFDKNSWNKWQIKSDTLQDLQKQG